MPTEAETLSILPLLKQIPLFADLQEEAHKSIIHAITLQYYPKNYILIREGEPGDAMYIIKSGQAIVYHEPKEAGDEEIVLANLGPNQFFGEMALITDQPRNASVRTLTDAEIFVLKKEDFLKLVSENSTMSTLVSNEFIERIKENKKFNPYGL